MCFAEVQRLQEQVRKLQVDAADEGWRQAQVDSLEQKVASLEGELLAAQRQCDQVNNVCTDQIHFACGRFSQSLSLRLSKRETAYLDNPRLIFCRRGRRSEARRRRQRDRPSLLEG